MADLWQGYEHERKLGQGAWFLNRSGKRRGNCCQGDCTQDNCCGPVHNCTDDFGAPVADYYDDEDLEFAAPQPPGEATMPELTVPREVDDTDSNPFEDDAVPALPNVPPEQSTFRQMPQRRAFADDDHGVKSPSLLKKASAVFERRATSRSQQSSNTTIASQRRSGQAPRLIKIPAATPLRPAPIVSGRSLRKQGQSSGTNQQRRALFNR